ncbi:MAG: carboxypeptidase regulatory-like domain-containing protein [Acidobacteria bacterium]|nr:carboxypeptidase regulatory-like domain-containing protein [Acidobacteriota bacterium]
MFKNTQQIRNILLVILLFFVLATESNNVFAQSAGSTGSTISGKITDEQKSVVNSATVTVTNIDTNFSREIVVGEDGAFSFNQLSPGNYKLTIKSDGFTTQMIPINVILGTNTLVPVELKIGQSAEVIEVRANTLLEGKTEGSTNIERTTIAGLPINRRNFLDFSTTSARVVSDGAAIGATATSGLSFNGQSGRFNNVTIDGLDNNDSGSGSVRATFSQDAVQEFQIISDNYSAEFGRALGGVVNIVTRGGSNQFSGSLFFFNRNDDTSAKDAFSDINPPYRQYQFGLVLGGPIKKDKAFFFTSFERLTIKQNTIVTISDTIVSAARRQGFVNVQNGPAPFSIGTTTLLSRLDFQLNPQNKLFVRYNGGFSFNSGFDTFGGLIDYTNSGRQSLDDNTVVVSNVYLNTGLNLVNETRFLFTNRIQDDFPTDPGPQVRITTNDGVNTFGRSSFLPQPRDQKFIQFVDNVSLTRGKHQIKFGGDVFITAPPEGKSALPFVPGGLAVFGPLNFTALTGIPGLPSFTGLETFDPDSRSTLQKAFLQQLALLLPTLAPGFPSGLPLDRLSLPSGYTQGFGDANIVVPAKFFAAFAQDDFKLRPNLLLKAGVRYDLNRSRFVPDNNGNFAPRLAFSFNPTKISNLRIKGSYGLFFAVPVTGVAVSVNLLGSGRVKVPVIPFPFSILPFSLPGHKFPDGVTVPAGVNLVPQFSQITKYEPNLRNSYTQQINFGTTYILKHQIALSLDYDFVRGIKLFSTRNINPVVRPVASTTQSLMNGRVDPTQGDIQQFESAFDSYFHAFTISATKRFDNRFSFLTSYTFSKLVDDVLDFGTLSREVVDSLNIRNERGLGGIDARSRFLFSGVWDINYTKNPLLTGFQLSSIVNLASGRPYNLLAGVDLNRNFDNPPGDRPLQGGVSIGRNAGITPGFASVDLRLTRSINFKEKFRLEGYVEAFNLFNRVNIDPTTIARVFLPDAQGRFNLPPKDGGRFTVTPDRFRGAFAPRQIQFGFRFSF